MLGEARQKRGSGLVIDTTQTNKTITLLAGVDAGSTETRIVLANKGDMDVFYSGNSDAALDTISQVYRIPSTYAIVEDAREIPSASMSLEDNYDSQIMLQRNGAEKPLISRHRILRGRKITDATGLVARYLDSSTNKTDNPIFYINVLDAIGYAILQKYSGSIPSEVNLYLALSVRPKELTTICKDRLRKNLQGTFVFGWDACDITLHIKDLMFTTEPEAQISGTITVYDLRSGAGHLDQAEADKLATMADQLYSSDCYVHIEGGGSSIGVEVVKGHNLVDSCSSTFQLGGNYMAQVFIDRVRETLGRTVTKEAANSAILTCQLRDGRNLLDVSEMVAQVKSQVAMSIVESLRHQVIDLAPDLSMPDVEFITLGGRLFAADDSGNTIGEYLEQYIQQISPNTEVITLAENFIPHGNLVGAINSEMGKEVKELMEAEEASNAPVAATYIPSFPPADLAAGDDTE